MAESTGAGGDSRGPAASAPGRWRRRLLVALLVVAALAAAVRAALPFAVARGIERGALGALGLPVAVANVDLALLRGVVSVDGIAVGRAGEPAGVGSLLRLERMGAEIAWLDLLSRRLHLRALSIEGPVLRLGRRADGSLDNPLPPSPPAEPEPGEAAPSSWSVAVDSLRLAGADLELAEPGRAEAALGFSLEELTLADVVLRGEELTLGGVGVRGPRLRVARDLVFPSAAPPGTAPPGPPAPAVADAGSPAPASGARYRLDRVEIERAGFALVTETGPLELELDLRAEGVGAAPGQTFPLSAALRVGGGELRSEGRAGLVPPAFDGTLRWRDLPFPLFVLAARPELAPWVRSCRAEGELELRVRLEPGPGSDEPAAARIAGRVAIRELAIGDPGEKEIALRWRALEVAVREATVPLAEGGEPIRVALERVRLDAPALRYGRPTPLLDALLRGTPADLPAPAAAEPAAAEPPPAAEPAPAGAPGAGVELTIDALELRGGAVAFADATPETPYAGAIRDLSVAARNVRWPALRARDVRVRGVAPERAPFSLRGSVDGPRGAFTFELQRLDLPAFDPYAAGAGYRLARGQASLPSTVRLEAERYVTESELLLHDLRLDAADAGAFEQQLGAPLDLALALLRDPSGDIRLPVPLAIERESLRVGLGPVVLGALRAAVVGVVSSPLKALGAALPGGGRSEVDLAMLPAVPGEAAPPEEAVQRIEAVAALLASRPLLAISLEGRAGSEDRPPLAARILLERAAAGEALPEVEGAGFLARRRIAAALAARSRGEASELTPDDGALVERMEAAIDVPAERLAALAGDRAAAVRERLLARGLDAARVALAEPAAEGAPGVALELVAHVEPVP